MADRIGSFDVTHGLTQGSGRGREMRRPQHPFALKHRPWQIQPFLMAPVLPGETLKNLLLQSRVVTDPIKNSLVGWWVEYYFFYVKHRDMPGRDDFTAMMLDPSKDLSAYEEASATSYWSYTGKGGMKWTEQCLEVVTEEYFRNEGELWDFKKLGELPIAQIGLDNWLDSVQTDTAFIVPDIDLDIDADGTIMASEAELGLQQWRLLRHGGLTHQTYEEWLSTYGVRASSVELHKPELIRYLREWTYPSNTVVPTTGAVSSAASWAIAERADKTRFFREPGFIFGVTVCRPKGYLSGTHGMACAFMNDAYSWLPAILTNDYRTSMKKFIGDTPGPATGPLQNTDDDYWVDMRDILLYGDQYVNFSLGDAGSSFVGLPDGLMQKRYVTSTMADSFFVSASPDNKVTQDGIVTLTIGTSQVDRSVTI